MMKHVHVGYAAPSIYINNGGSGTLTLKPSSTTLNIGDSIVIEISEESAIWKSSNPNVVTVDQNGKITAVGSGKAVITAIFEDKKGTCVVTVPNAELDAQYMYYGTIKTPHSEIFKNQNITLSEITRAINENTLTKYPLKQVENDSIDISAGDAVIVLLPNKIYTATKQEDEIPFDETIAGANGIKMGDFYVYGEVLIVSGNITINVE